MEDFTMKKFLTFFLTICLCMIIFTSCKPKFEPQSAKELWDKINETMENLKAYESSGTGTLSLTVSGERIAMDITMNSIVSGLNTDDYYYYSSSKTSAKKPGMFSDKLYEFMYEKNMEAFHDGKMFVSTESNEHSQKIYSSLTKEEYMAYRERKDTDTADIDFNDCTNASFAQNEDGTWSLQYSGYTKKTMDEMLETFGMNDAGFDFDVQDMEISILSDSEFRVKEMNIKFIFDEADEGSTAPSFEISTQYSNYNAATPITDILNPEKYTEIEDCTLIYEFEDMLKDIEEKTNGSFTLEMEQTLSIPSMNQSQIYSERETVIYGKKNGAYFYDATATTGSENFEISYANGTQTIRVSGQEQTVSQTEDAAKAYIQSLINTAKYDADYVSLMTKKSDGVYEIQCHQPESSAYDAIFEAYSGKTRSILQTITITVENGSIVKIENHTLAKGYASTGYQQIEMEIKVTSTNVFNQ